jgi:hypothetical protein
MLGGAEDAVEEGGGGSGPGGGDERPGDVFEVLITCESEVAELNRDGESGLGPVVVPLDLSE